MAGTAAATAMHDLCSACCIESLDSEYRRCVLFFDILDILFDFIWLFLTLVLYSETAIDDSQFAVF
jgi:hypothetical protein